MLSTREVQEDWTISLPLFLNFESCHLRIMVEHPHSSATAHLDVLQLG